MKELYLYLQDLISGKKFFKYFECEWDMDKFKRKLKFSKKLIIIEDSREMSLIDYEKW